MSWQLNASPAALHTSLYQAEVSISSLIGCAERGPDVSRVDMAGGFLGAGEVVGQVIKDVMV